MKNQILQCLKGVKYPDFNKDIMSCGFVKEIEVLSSNQNQILVEKIAKFGAKCKI